MENLFWVGFVGAAVALIFALLQRNKVMKFSEGDEKMVKIASAIRKGANAYLRRQYTTVAKVFAVVFVILLIIASFVRDAQRYLEELSGKDSSDDANMVQ